jgi:hypothetical protein
VPALFFVAQVILGHPSWLRRILGRDRYRVADSDGLLKVGCTLKPGVSEETPLISGWHIPEPTGCWTLGHEATIAWCVGEHEQDLLLQIDGTAALDERVPVQRIDLWANDRRLASWRFKLDTPSLLPPRVLVPRDLIRNRDVLMLTFLIRRPGIYGRGLYLRSLTLEAAQG